MAAALKSDRFVPYSRRQRVHCRIAERAWLKDFQMIDSDGRKRDIGTFLRISLALLRQEVAAVPASAKPPSKDPAWSDDRHVFQAFTPDEAVVVVRLSKVLIEICFGTWLRRVIAYGKVHRRLSGLNRSPRSEPERDVAPEANRIAKISA